MALTLTKLAETSTTITLAWTAPPDAQVYVFYAGGKRVSTGTAFYTRGEKKGQPREEVNFGKTGEPYEVAALCRDAAGVFRVELGTYPAAPPAADYDYRFASYDPATDKIWGVLNRFKGSPHWWKPGTPEGTPWPSGGGIKPVTHATYGPGFQFITTDEMLYVAGSGINCRNAVDPSIFGGDTRLERPVAGSTHTWEGTFMRPSGYSWPPGEQHESLWELFATHDGFNAVYHHLFLSNGAWAPGFKYYLALQTATPTESPPQSNLWQRHVCPIPFNENEHHTIRWQIGWSSPGVANGFMKAWTSVEGGPFQQWLNLTNIVTKLSSFQRCYGLAQTGLRAPLGGGPISYFAYNLRVTIT